MIASVTPTIEIFGAQLSKLAPGSGVKGNGHRCSFGDALETLKRLSPSASIDRMARVQRPPIQANVAAEAVQLDEPFRGVVAPLAQALEWAKQNLLTSPRCASTWSQISAAVTIPRSRQNAENGCSRSWCLRILAQRAVEYHFPILSVGRERPWTKPIHRQPKHNLRAAPCGKDATSKPARAGLSKSRFQNDSGLPQGPDGLSVLG